MEHYLDFFEAEGSDAQIMQRLRDLLSEDNYPELRLIVAFIAESCPKLMTTLTLLETSKTPIAPRVWNMLDDLESFLMNGCAKVLFGDETDELLSEMGQADRHNMIDTFHNVFTSALAKLSKHWDNHPARRIFKSARIFDPQQAPGLSKNVEDHAPVVDKKLSDEWFAYQQFTRNASNADLCIDNDGNVIIADFWRGNGTRYVKLAEAAKKYIWFPCGSVDVERSFGSYKTLLDDKRQALTHEHTKQLAAMYFNGDIVGRWEGYRHDQQ